jgi:hypothetical protein
VFPQSLVSSATRLRAPKEGLRALAAALVFVLTASACGGGSTPKTNPSSAGGLVAKVASYDIAVGKQRFLAGLVTPDQRLIGWGTVKMQFAYLGTRNQALKGNVSEEVTASYLPIPSELGTPDPTPKPGPTVVAGAEGRGVYAADVTFDKAGFWGLVVEASVDRGKPTQGKAAFEVFPTHHYPWIGEEAPRSENLTMASTDVPKAAIDSRAVQGDIPDQALHMKTVAQAIATGKPTLLVVSTPVYCISRFCGPVTDLVLQLARQYGDKANFIHIEVWRDFQNQVVNKAAAEWASRDNEVVEPWVWLIGGDGKIVGRWDNVATRQEIEPVLKSLLPA